MTNRFGKMIETARKRKKLCTQHAAYDLGISKTQLWSLENGFSCNPTAKTLIACRKLYGLTAEQMINSLEVIND